MYINVHYKQKACGFVPYFYWTFLFNICITHFTSCTGSYHNSRRYVLTNLVSFDVFLGCLTNHPPARLSTSTRQAGLKPLQINRIRRGFEELAEKKNWYVTSLLLSWKFFHLTLFLFFVQLAGSKGETKTDQTTRTKRVHHQYNYIASIFVFSSIVSGK